MPLQRFKVECDRLSQLLVRQLRFSQNLALREVRHVSGLEGRIFVSLGLSNFLLNLRLGQIPSAGGLLGRWN